MTVTLCLHCPRAAGGGGEVRAGGGGERQQAQGAEVSTHLGSCEKQDPVRVVSLLHIAIVSTDLFVLRTGWPVILLSKKDTSLGLFPYFLILLSFFGLKLVLNILLWLQSYEI